MNLKNKTALITGAARGIGRQIAIELAKSGCNIIGVDLKVDALAETEKDVLAQQCKFYRLACDVANQAEVSGLLTKAKALTGDFHILVNNAGVLPSGPFLATDFQDWQRTIDINLVGLMRVTYEVLPMFIEQGRGHIVNIASIAGKFGTEGVAAYAASKHGVVGFSSALRAELKGTGVSVSWVCPCPARTRLAENVKHTFLTPLVESIDVAVAARRAAQEDLLEVFVPGYVRVTTSIFPALFPRLARWILRVSGASRGWLDARQKIQV